MALTQDRDTARRDGTVFVRPVAANTQIFAGSMVGVAASGVIAPAGTAGVVAIVGVAEYGADNRQGQAGEAAVSVRRGVFAFRQSGTAITHAAYGKPVAAIDDETVALLDPGASPAQIVAGVVRSVDDDGVWVEF